MDLLQSTYELIDRWEKLKPKPSQRDVAEAAGVGREWLAKFSQRRIASPGTPRVQKVHDYLSKVIRKRA